MIDKTELLQMGDSPIVSQYMALSKAGVDLPPLYNDGQLIEENVWSWVLKTVAAGFGGQFKPYPTYGPAGNKGIFKMPDTRLTIGLLADWASDTTEARTVARLMGAQNDYTIHLGDTYFVGSADEIKANFFPGNGGTWPYGKRGSFALLGNHEMYSGGDSYFNDLLPLMGTYVPNTNRTVNEAQTASFFCLENDYWRIIGLDTGYESLNYPLKLTQNANLDLTPEQKHWLQDIVRLNDDKRGIIFLSHHQCFSAFEAEFSKPQETISTMMNPARDVLWLWGHEHWFSVYGANKMHNGGNIFARCIGNGGMPVELYHEGGIKRPKNNMPHSPENRNLVIYDQRPRQTLPGGIVLGHNGYVIATIEGPTLTLSYFDDRESPDNKLLEEQWTADKATGKITGDFIKDLTANGQNTAQQQLSPFIGADLNEAISAPKK